MKYNLYILAALILTPCLQANVLSDTWNKAKQTAQSAYNKAQMGRDGVNKNAVIAGSTFGGAGAVAAMGYNAYASKQTQMHTRPRPSTISEEQQYKYNKNK